MKTLRHLSKKLKKKFNIIEIKDKSLIKGLFLLLKSNKVKFSTKSLEIRRETIYYR